MSGNGEEDAVDVFGRIIINKDKRKSEAENGGVASAKVDHGHEAGRGSGGRGGGGRGSGGRGGGGRGNRGPFIRNDQRLDHPRDRDHQQDRPFDGPRGRDHRDGDHLNRGDVFDRDAPPPGRFVRRDDRRFDRGRDEGGYHGHAGKRFRNQSPPRGGEFHPPAAVLPPYSYAPYDDRDRRDSGGSWDREGRDGRGPRGRSGDRESFPLRQSRFDHPGGGYNDRYEGGRGGSGKRGGGDDRRGGFHGPPGRRGPSDELDHGGDFGMGGGGVRDRYDDRDPHQPPFYRDHHQHHQGLSGVPGDGPGPRNGDWSGDRRGGEAAAAGGAGAGRGASGDVQPLPPAPKVKSAIAPLMSFKSFMQNQQEDLAPEAFQQRYDEYHLHYLADFSDAFFRRSLQEEWFQERYSPAKITALEQDTCAWAAAESGVIRDSLLARPAEVVAAMCLDPTPRRHRGDRVDRGDCNSKWDKAASSKHPRQQMQKQQQQMQQDELQGEDKSSATSSAAESTEKVADVIVAVADGTSDEGAGNGGDAAATDSAAGDDVATDAPTSGDKDGANDTFAEADERGGRGGDGEEGEGGGEDEEQEEEEELEEDEVAGKHMAGHERRTVYVHGVHACCSKAVFKAAVVRALTSAAAGTGGSEADPLPAPDRILIAQPTWNNRDMERFDRSAWIVMPTSASAKQALGVLRELRITVPGEIDPRTGEPGSGSFVFTLSAHLHIPRKHLTTGEFSSHALRVQADTTRALELAASLDEDRNVPEDTCLATIAALPEVSAALVKPTDRLDLAIAYLRRVHFVSFYTGRRFRDESHLLSMSAAVTLRSRPYIPIPPGLQAAIDRALAPAPPRRPPPLPPGPPPATAVPNGAGADVDPGADGDADVDPGADGDADVDPGADGNAVGDDECKANGSDEAAAGDAAEEENQGLSEQTPTADDLASAGAGDGAPAATTEPAEQKKEDDNLQVGHKRKASHDATDDAGGSEDATTGKDALVDEGGREQEEEAAAAAAAGVIETGNDEDRDIVTGDDDPASGGALSSKHGPPLPLLPRGVRSNVPLNDKRVEIMIMELRARLAQKQAKLANPALSLSPDEDDAQILLERQQETMEKLVLEKCVVEKEGKCRCCYPFCNKLFKGADFLRKHMQTKHANFGSAELAADAEPFMRRRFEAEELAARPLPPVEVETRGHIELKSVREILEKHAAAVAARGGAGGPGAGGGGGPPIMGGQIGGPMGMLMPVAGPGFDHAPPRGMKRRWSGGDGEFMPGGGGGGGFRRRGQDDRDRRASMGGPVPPPGHRPPPPPQQVYMEPKSEDNYSRKISSYLDVDAPKESAVSVDYGVALMPPVKRKKTKK